MSEEEGIDPVHPYGIMPCNHEVTVKGEHQRPTTKPTPFSRLRDWLYGIAAKLGRA